MKPIVVYTRPRDWSLTGYSSDKLDLIYVPISGENPVKRNGRPAGDGIGDVLTKAGVAKLLQTIREKQPQVFFHAIHAKVGEPILRQVRVLSPRTKIIVANGNDPNKVGGYVASHRAYVDAVLLNSQDPKVWKLYREAGFSENQVGVLYDGFELKDHPAPSKTTPTFDCFFAGSNQVNEKGVHIYQNGRFRKQFIYRVRESFKLDLHGHTHEWGIPVSKRLNYPQYYQSFHDARIAINVNHLELVRYYTRRTIHAGASGRLYVVKYIPGMEADFGENGEHLVWFNTIEQGLDRIDYYLQNEKLREETAARCRDLFLRKHTWRNRLEDFEKFVLALL